MSDESSSGSAQRRTEIPYDYGSGNNNNNNHNNSRPPLFNGDVEKFPWWKSRLYGYIISIDEDLWDIVEDGIDIEVDDEGKTVGDRKKLSDAEKKIYKKHHRVRGILCDAIPHEEFVKVCNKSTAKTIFDSLCSSYEGNQQVREAKANMLVQKYELFKMSEDETIDAMFSRFQILISGLQVLKKSYATSDHVKKILRSLPARWRPKVTAIEEARDLNTLSLENLISSLKCHELGFSEAESSKKSKSIALKSKDKEAKSLRAAESEEEILDDSDEDSEAEEYALLTKRFQKWAMKNKKSYKSKGSGSKKEDKNCYNCKKPGHFIAECPEMKKDSSKKDKRSSSKSNFKSKFRKSLMAAWDELDKDSGSEKEDDEEANLALMATTSSDLESESDSDDEDEVLSELSNSELISMLKDSIKLYVKQSKELKASKHSYAVLLDEVEKLRTIKKNQQMLMNFVEQKYLSLKQNVSDGIPYEPVCEYELALEEFLWTGFERSKLASMIYHVSRNRGECVGFTGRMFDSEGKSLKRHLDDDIPIADILRGTDYYFGKTGVFEEDELKISEPETSEPQILDESDSHVPKYHVLNASEEVLSQPQILNKSEEKIVKEQTLKNPVSKASTVQTMGKQESKTLGSKIQVNPKKGKLKARIQENSQLKQTKVQILKRPDSQTKKSQNLTGSESKLLNVSEKRNSSYKTKYELKPKNNVQKGVNKTEFYGFNHNSLKKKKFVNTNNKGPIKLWVPKNEIFYVAGVSTSKDKATFLVPGQWLLASHDRRQAYVPNPEHERGRFCGVWRAPKREDSWYWYDR